MVIVVVKDLGGPTTAETLSKLKLLLIKDPLSTEYFCQLYNVDIINDILDVFNRSFAKQINAIF